jgi:hypothetical protein
MIRTLTRHPTLNRDITIHTRAYAHVHKYNQIYKPTLMHTYTHTHPWIHCYCCTSHIHTCKHTHTYTYSQVAFVHVLQTNMDGLAKTYTYAPTDYIPQKHAHEGIPTQSNLYLPRDSLTENIFYCTQSKCRTETLPMLAPDECNGSVLRRHVF